MHIYAKIRSDRCNASLMSQHTHKSPTSGRKCADMDSTHTQRPAFGNNVFLSKATCFKHLLMKHICSVPESLYKAHIAYRRVCTKSHQFRTAPSMVFPSLSLHIHHMHNSVHDLALTQTPHRIHNMRETERLLRHDPIVQHRYS